MRAPGLLVFLVLVTWVSAGPIDMRMGQLSTCARRCTESSKFKYMPGTTYEHEYHVTTDTLMEGANSRKATIQISAIADIEVESKCDFILRLRDVKLYDTSKTHLTFVDNAGRFKRVLERSPLRFSFQDGIIEDLCPADDEDPWALNIKRGILTSLQNSMDDLERDQTVQETDVTGNCVTEYKLKNRGWYSNTISKTKDLMSCTDRHGYKSAIHAIPYRVPSSIQSMPLMKSTHECDHTIDRTGIIKSAICRESHIYRPFSNHKSGAVTNVLQKLLYTRQKNTMHTARGMPWSRASMNFRHVYGFGNTDHQMNIEYKLNELCTIASNDIRPEVPRLFTELVYIMKEMDASSIMGVFSRIQSGSLCSSNIQRARKFFLDAIPMAGTTDAVEIMKQMLTTNMVTGVEVDMWLTSLAFIQHPTKEMLVAVKPLIETPNIMMKAMLPVTSLVNNYCEVNPACAEEAAVVNIITALESHIGARCYASSSSRLDVVLMALRAIGNAGHVPRIASVLNNCITQASNPTEVKIAALEAFRRLPCYHETSTVISLFRDVQEDSEIRIAAYLAAMHCPTEHILNIVLQTLEHEQVDHVGSFIWSHLTNLMETACPHKQAIRAILENEQLKQEFNLEKMKFSRNYEGSLFFEKFNTGAMLESNLIWSPKSFIPRSAMVNLTVDLFGNSINLFDLGGRVEGLEYLLETYLGPYGYFGKKNTMAAASELDKIKGSMYMRMFGNEMLYKNFKGLDMFGRGKNFNFMNILKKLSDTYDYSTTQSVMFLDSTMIIPTSSGLPLMLAVNGTATVDMKAKGKVDLRKLYNSPRSLQLEGVIQPSGAVLISGTMSVDAGVTKTGMRVVNTWHSSTAVQGRVELMRGKILHAEIDMPKEKMEILDVT
ncbi:apolipophorins-like [Gigantopelta aegis]|uniref:apolipophorins-like n=1 Tax=Gigantopelta aegis TaxID=1735272 RepID=UPI001B88CC19|nr:apolipophorins-like [Gigantopelta aegis]